ncbi:MAG TPA: rhomboid family intramembrane serine protease [Bacteroidales bacterium]|nr:rhomboid family intramembrane serine protease [Bacteroidales bacterium]
MQPENNRISNETEIFRKKFFLSLVVPGIFVFILWLIKILEMLFEKDLSFLGIYPLELKGLPGILFAPLIHENFRHLLSNSVPLLLLGSGLFYFYSEVALKVSGWIYLLTGVFVWLGAREAWHIGASGIVYGLASFLFFSGIIRKYYRLVALSLLVVFLYGSMIWGMVPELYRDVSWESHMMGFVSGIIMAIAYRKEGPQDPVIEWMKDDYVEPDGEAEVNGGK